MTIMKIKEHFQTITYHRKLVREGCFKVGLYWQGLTHDLSKFSPTEFLMGAVKRISIELMEEKVHVCQLIRNIL